MRIFRKFAGVTIIAGFLGNMLCAQTVVSIRGDQFYINDKPTYEGRLWKGSRIEGLLINSRMVQAVFDDSNPETLPMFAYPDTKKWDAQRNNREFVEAMALWKSYGLNCITINMQGGSPTGYQYTPCENPGFARDGALQEAYMQRLDRVLKRADELEMVVILGLFYFGQDQFMEDEEAIRNATRNMVDWLFDKGYRNVLIEICNETRSDGAYEHRILWPDRVHELIKLVKKKKKNGYRYLAGTSFCGMITPTSNVVKASDFLLIHGNGAAEPHMLTELATATRNVEGYRPMPVVNNEDDHYGFDLETNNFSTSMENYVSWGYLDFRHPGETDFSEGYQSVPVDWGINSERKKAFFDKVAEITGTQAPGAQASGLSADPKGSKPNVLFIFADQLRSMDLACYGATQVKTPNIDRLAEEGIRFTDAISTYPVCSPFRAMLMTGNYPAKNGMLTNDHMLRNQTPYFAEAFKDAGYKTAFIGKWHLNGLGRTEYIPSERQCGFDYWRALECTHNYFNSMYYKDNSDETHFWEDYDALSQAREVCKYIDEEAGEEPFALMLGWGPPHDPYIAPPEFMDRFSPESVQLRPNVNEFAQAIKMWKQANTTCPESLKQIPENITPALMDTTNASIRQWYAGYFAAIEALDEYMGLILHTLEEKGILDNTIIVFTSDHGDNLGSHRQQGKELPYEESLSIPFMIRYPEKISAGSKTDALLSPIDMMPTVLSLADVSCPDVDGKDLSGIAEGRQSDVQDAVLIMKLTWLGTNWLTNGNGPWRGVRTKRYTYARKSTTLEPWMLFDNEKDPLQLNNLAGDPAYASLLAKLDQRTDELLVEAGDPENPFYFLNVITREREAENLPDRYYDFHPCFQKPGTVFQPFLEKYGLLDY